MQVFSTINTLREALLLMRDSGSRIGLVPTMGNLHAGHLALVKAAAEQCDVVVASIFVNPTQFGANEDFAAYPRSLDSDLTQLRHAGCDLVFTPSVAEMYGEADTAATLVRAAAVSRGFCGEHRPGHFDGVATVVAKLFNIVTPHNAYFGLKDYQQFLVIKRLAADLAFGVAVIGIETVRETDGLAMSSRNGYLTAAERKQSTALSQSLLQCHSAILGGEREYALLESRALATLTQADMEPEYFAVRNAADLTPPTESSTNLVVLAAARIGNTRLIDNIRFELPQA